MNPDTEEILDCRSLRLVVGGLGLALAIGVLGGLAAGKAIWKKPCEHCTIISNVVWRNEVIGTNWRGTAITLTNSP